VPRMDMKRFRSRGCDGIGLVSARGLSPPFGCHLAEQPARYMSAALRGFLEEQPQRTSALRREADPLIPLVFRNNSRRVANYYKAWHGLPSCGTLW
jgi:hypothetical protein